MNHNEPDYLDALPSTTDNQGIDVILEMLANVNLVNDFTYLNKFGRIVIVGNRGSLDFNPRLAMGKEADILGMAVWNAPIDEYNESLIGIEAALKNGGLKPIVGKIFPLNEAQKAHVEIIEGKAKGKMVLKIQED